MAGSQQLKSDKKMPDRWYDFNRVAGYRRRFASLLGLATRTRMANYLRNAIEYRARCVSLSSLPTKVIVDTTNVCNLRCPLCVTGAGLTTQRLGYMKLETFKSFFAQVKDQVLFVNLFNWGEPFLSPHIFKIIDAIKESGAISHVHSNFNLKKAGLAEKIAESNLTSLVVSIDGASSETYRTYRRRGDFDLVMDNVRRFTARRKELGKVFPEIVWKLIVHRHNEHELGKAEAMARAVGVDRLELTPIWADRKPGTSDKPRQDEWAKEWLPVAHPEFRFDSRKEPLFETACPFLWKDPVINVDGTVSPCAFVSGPECAFGDLKTSTFREIWNNDVYRYSRSLFSRHAYGGPRVGSACDSCTLYRQIEGRQRQVVEEPPVEAAAA
jgi:radical SAM protein with 4Fe4S-binding SPASM domain